MTFNLTTISTSQTSRATATRDGRSRVSWRRLAFVVVSLSANLIVASRGQGDEDDVDVAAPVAEGQFVITEQQFDQMLFGAQQRQVAVWRVVNGERQAVGTSRSNPHPEWAFRTQVEAIIVAEIQAVDQRVSLTEAQKRKLQLAGRGGIVQLLSRMAELRTKLTSKPLDRQEYVEFMQELQSLRTSSQFGVLGETSLFQKTLRHTLTAEQFTRYRILERERQARMIDGVLINLASTANIEWAQADDTNPSVSERRQANRKRFIDELLAHGELPLSQNAYLQYIVLLEIGRLEDRLKPLVIDESWKQLQTKVTEARQLEPTLRKSKLWPVAHADDDEVTDDKAKD